jgi:hypothetical protein
VSFADDPNRPAAPETVRSDRDLRRQARFVAASHMRAIAPTAMPAGECGTIVAVSLLAAYGQPRRAARCGGSRTRRYVLELQGGGASRCATRYFVVHYFDEYIWIQSAHVGGLDGIVDACNATGTVEATWTIRSTVASMSGGNRADQA